MQFPGSHSGAFTPPNVTIPQKLKTVTGNSPGLLTSTGGLFGTIGALIVPVLSLNNNKVYFCTIDPANFNCEEDCIYNFPQENIKVGYAISSYKIIVIYRNLGLVTVTFNLTVFRRGLTTYGGKKNIATVTQGKYNTESKTMILGSSKPDNQLYTIDFNIINSGDRPQLSILRKANAGPFSLISATLVGNLEEIGKV
jgi:hypothetical protein